MTSSIDADHVVLDDEGHLEVELGELGLAVRAQVLVAKAARDLEVAFEAADHEQLLEELRRLRQRVPRAAREPAGDEEVARALGRGAREHRRLDLEEVALVEHAADERDELVAQRERVRHRGAAQVERAVAQPDELVHGGLLVDREGRRLGLREHLDPADVDLDLSGRQLGVDVLRAAAHDGAARAQHVLRAQLMRDRVRLAGARGERRAGGGPSDRAGR